ncbi:SH3 domain-containing protein [Acuticoccus mangrovi]|uniref:SH3 domain-containing protein n=1 Tax=Acuticoccus mangrovi TaxID=2796142 RepID=A0A934MGM1_9HYPH|nr:SH3 domain-containing protein [Acuticoccus mangrovi]MBJ3775136.1 SH3 domain-containing protein [Acuticoccus mangrovi]
MTQPVRVPHPQSVARRHGVWRRLRRSAAIALLAASPLAAASAPAMAATPAVTTATLNVRAGPDTAYPVVTVLPVGAAVTIHACLADRSWCDIAEPSGRGWVAARYLTTLVGSTRVVVTPQVVLPVPAVTYTSAYWNTHYAAYPWYRRGPAYYVPHPVYRRPPPPPRGACVNGCSATRSVTGPRGNTVVRSGTVSR